MAEAKYTPGSIAALAEDARMMPWDKSIEDVPFGARYAFQRAITADHYIGLVEAAQAVNVSAVSIKHLVGADEYSISGEALRRLIAALSKAPGESQS